MTALPGKHTTPSLADTTCGNKEQAIPKRTKGHSYTPALGELICEGLAEGLSLKTICASAPNMPTERAIRRWIIDESHPLSHIYMRAREIGLEKLGDDVIALADSADSDNYNAIRLQIDARKWYLSKVAPKVYGDRQHVDLNAKVETKVAMPDDVGLARLLAAAMADAKVIDGEPIALLAHDTGSDYTRNQT